MTAAAPFALRRGSVVLGGQPVLHHVDLTVEAGEFVALLGANGSGKTTLVRALVGLQPLGSGELRLFGTPLARFREWARIGFVPQRHVPPGGLPATVGEVVLSGTTPRARLLQRVSAADRTAVAEALATVGLSDRAHDRIETLSGGQQQRASIARALAGSPDVLVLDEPTAGVDSENQHALTETIVRLGQLGRAVLLVTHHLGELAEHVDRAVVLDGGHVAHDGPIPEGGMALGDVHADDHHHPAPTGDRRWRMQ